MLTTGVVYSSVSEAPDLIGNYQIYAQIVIKRSQASLSGSTKIYYVECRAISNESKRLLKRRIKRLFCCYVSGHPAMMRCAIFILCTTAAQAV